LGLAITPLPASALIAGLRILGAEEGLPRLPDLEFAIYEKARRDKAAAALVAVLLTRARGPSRPAIRSRAIFGEGLLLAQSGRSPICPHRPSASGSCLRSFEVSA
jgi:hypothetical protein